MFGEAFEYQQRCFVFFALVMAKLRTTKTVGRRRALRRMGGSAESCWFLMVVHGSGRGVAIRPSGRHQPRLEVRVLEEASHWPITERCCSVGAVRFAACRGHRGRWMKQRCGC